MSDPTQLTFASRLKNLRERAGLSQQGLAVAAGLSISLITQMEHGSRSDPKMSTLIALARALGVNCRALTGETENAPKKPSRKGKAK
jgi:transcriptional regulator with XRE-family HTH domain